MTPASFPVLHVGHGHEVTWLEYLYRVALSLSAVGGLAVLVLWWSRVVDAARSAFGAGRDGD